MLKTTKGRPTLILIGTLAALTLAFVLFGRTFLYSSPTESLRTYSSDSNTGRPSEERIIVYYHERRPYYVTTSRQVHGLIADRVNWVFKEAGIPYVWRKMPAKRQLEMIRNNTQRACAVGWFKTPERESYGKFTFPIYMDRRTLAIARADNDQIRSGLPLAQTLSNRRLRLLRKDGYSYGRFIDRGINRYAPREVITTAENISMVRMIHSHRADYFFMAKEEAEDLILSANLPPEEFQAVHFSDMPPGNNRYIICSRNIEEMAMLRINRAIKSYLLGSLTSQPESSSVVQ